MNQSAGQSDRTRYSIIYFRCTIKYGVLTCKYFLFAVTDDRAVPIEHLVAQSEVEVVSGVVQAGQRVQPDQQGDGIRLAVVVCRRPRRAAPATRHGRPVRLGDVQVAVRTARVRVRGEPADGETVQRHLRPEKTKK